MSNGGKSGSQIGDMIGETLGSYTVIGHVGSGGMGEVYLAQHTRIERRAAIKVLLPDLSSNHEVVERFFAEARATSSIRHHGIVEVLDCAVHSNGRAYIVMELLEGESLAARLLREPRFGSDIDLTLTIADAVADALAAAHAKGIVHRDLKPDNIFLAGDQTAPLGFAVKILDFGIAKLMGDGDGGRGGSMRTRTGSLLGTPAYMSPEQCRGAGLVDHRTDIYSLGCIVFELLAGRRPFVHEGFGELISAHLHEAPPSFASLGVDLPPDVERWVGRLLAKARDDRFATMAAVSASIRELRHRSTAVLPSLAGAVGAPPATKRTEIMPAVGYPVPATTPGRAPATPPPAGASPGVHTPAPGGTVMLPATRRPAAGAATAMPTATTTTLSAHATENVRPRAQPVGKWALGALAVVALIGGGLFLARSGPTPAPGRATPEPARAAEPVAPAAAVDASDGPAATTVLPSPPPPTVVTPPVVAPPASPAAPGERNETHKRRPHRPAGLSDDARKL